MKLLRIYILLHFICCTSLLYGYQEADSVNAFNLYSEALSLKDSHNADSAFLLFENAAENYKQLMIWEGYLRSKLESSKIKMSKTDGESVIDDLNVLIEECKSSLGTSHILFARLHLLLADTNKKFGHYEVAVDNYLTSMKIAEKIAGGQADLALIYQKLGAHYSNLGKPNEAMDLLKKALAIFETNGEIIALAKVNNAIGSAFRKIGNYSSAIGYYQKSINQFLTQLDSNHHYLSDPYDGLGIVYAQTSKFPEALLYFEKVLQIDLHTYGEEHTLVANAYNHLGILHDMMGNYDESINLQRKSLAIKKKLLPQDHPNLITSYLGLSVVYSLKGDVERGKLFASKALQIQLKVYGDNHPEIANSYNVIGNANLKLNNDAAALINFKKAESILTADNQVNHRIGPIYHNLANLYMKKSQFEQALEYGHKALKLNSKYNGKLNLFTSQNHALIGNIYLADDQFEIAMSHFEKSLSIALEVYGNRQQTVADSYQKISEAYLSVKDFENARLMVQKGLIANSKNFNELSIQSNPSNEEALSETKMILLLGLKGSILYQQFQASNEEGLLVLSLTAFENAISLLDQLKVSYKSHKSFSALREHLDPVFKNAVSVAYELYNLNKDLTYLDKAFFFAENSKATLLLSAIHENSALAYANIPSVILEEEKRLRRDLTYYEQELSNFSNVLSIPDSLLRKEYQNKSFLLKKSYDSLIADLERNYPDYHNLKYKTNSATRKQLQSEVLTDDDLLIAYFNANDNLYIFCMAKNEQHFIKVANVENLDSLINDVRQVLINKDYQIEKFADKSYQLYELCLAPISSFLQQKRLLIIPDGLLNYLPFEILISDMSKKQLNFLQLPYLLKSNSISYAVSATLYKAMKQGKKMLENPGYVAFSPNFNQKSNPNLLDSDELLAMNDVIRGDLAPLLGAKIEASTIAELISGQLFDGIDATESRFKQLASGYSVIHLATHAVVDDQNPMNSRLLFTAESDSIDDGNLYAWELYNMKLNADMAVLSACNTGFGKLQRGEGVMSLGRAFLYAGCPSIIMSLWPVQDQSTAEIITTFYEGLFDHKSKDEALQMAKLKYLESADELNSHPFYWAGFVAQGNTAPIQLEATSRNWMIYLVGFVMISVVILYVRKVNKW